MVIREQDKHFLWSILVAIGGILVWRGIWEGAYEIPILADPWMLLFVGFAILTFSGAIFKEFDPLGSVEKSALKVMHYVHNNSNKEEFEIKYKDKNKNKEMRMRGDTLKQIEKGVLVFKHERKNQEKFVPLHRITEVAHKGKIYWKL